MAQLEPIRQSVSVPAEPAKAYERFTQDLNLWWPNEYTWSQAALVEIGITTRQGGLCYELGPHGFHCDWGRVLVWDPPARLIFLWQIGTNREPVPDPALASEVEVTFSPDGASTRVTLEHRDLERHGESAEAYRSALASARGWPFILEKFAASF